MQNSSYRNLLLLFRSTEDCTFYKVNPPPLRSAANLYRGGGAIF
jgi:hypothetical protein